MMIVMVAIGTRISSLSSGFSYFRCMKNQSTRPALAEAIRRLAAMLQTPSSSLAAKMVSAGQENQAEPGRTKVREFTNVFRSRS